MLTLLGRPMGKSCDGVNRRSFLQVGALGLGAGAFTLADVNRAEAARASMGLSTSRHKSVINIFLGGGPPHQDMFDLKPDAPAEIRGILDGLVRQFSSDTPNTGADLKK